MNRNYAIRISQNFFVKTAFGIYYVQVFCDKMHNKNIKINSASDEWNISYFLNKGGRQRKAAGCDYCANYVYDDETGTYYCDVNLDEDEYYRFLYRKYEGMSLLRNGMNTELYVIR